MSDFTKALKGKVDSVSERLLDGRFADLIEARELVARRKALIEAMQLATTGPAVNPLEEIPDNPDRKTVRRLY